MSLFNRSQIIESNLLSEDDDYDIGSSDETSGDEDCGLDEDEEFCDVEFDELNNQSEEDEMENLDDLIGNNMKFTNIHRSMTVEMINQDSISIQKTSH